MLDIDALTKEHKSAEKAHKTASDKLKGLHKKLDALTKKQVDDPTHQGELKLTEAREAVMAQKAVVGECHVEVQRSGGNLDRASSNPLVPNILTAAMKKDPKMKKVMKEADAFYEAIKAACGTNKLARDRAMGLIRATVAQVGLAMKRKT